MLGATILLFKCAAPLNPNPSYSHFLTTQPPVPSPPPHPPRRCTDRLHAGAWPTAPPPCVPQRRANCLHIGASPTAPPPHASRRCATSTIEVHTTHAPAIKVHATRVPAVKVYGARSLLLCMCLHSRRGPPPPPSRTSPLSLLHSHPKMLMTKLLKCIDQIVAYDTIVS
jgi:hypothetical protein